jgi:hypothetical protein
MKDLLLWIARYGGLIIFCAWWAWWRKKTQGKAMKHHLLKKFLLWTLRKRPNLQPHLKLLLGAVYGNVELHGYMGTAKLLLTLKTKGIQNARRKK